MVNRDGTADIIQAMRVDGSEAQRFESRQVVAMTLDTLANKHSLERLALVKMDIEGAEPLALSKTCPIRDHTKLPLFIFEVYKLGLKRMRFSPMDMISYFPLYLFELYFVNRSHPNPLPQFEVRRLYRLGQPELHPWPWHSNVIAVPRIGCYTTRAAWIAQSLESARLEPNT